MPQTTSTRVHLFHGSQLLATVEGPTTRAEPYYTLEDGSVVQAISYLTVTHLDGTPGLDVQVVPQAAAPTPPSHPTAPGQRHPGHRA